MCGNLFVSYDIVIPWVVLKRGIPETRKPGNPEIWRAGKQGQES